MSPSFQANSSLMTCEATAPASWTSRGDGSSSGVSRRRHAHLKTTARYLHYRARGDDAGRFADAFKTAAPTASALEVNDPQTGAAGFREHAPVEIVVA